MFFPLSVYFNFIIDWVQPSQIGSNVVTASPTNNMFDKILY